MIIRYYLADYVDKTGKIQASYSFTAETNAKARIEATRYKQSLGCTTCSSCKTIVILTGKVYPEPEPK